MFKEFYDGCHITTYHQNIFIGTKEICIVDILWISNTLTLAFRLLPPVFLNSTLNLLSYM